VDQWEVEELIKVLRKAKVKLYTKVLSAQDIRKCHMEPIASVEQGISDSLSEYGPDAKINVIPSGPYVLPYI
jgi:nickel-dependent lactate racemase